MSLLLFMACTNIFADNIFSDKQTMLSFRYPDNWSERKPQLHTTIVLLFADDGSDATCNVTSQVFKELNGLTEAKLENLRASNHKKSYFEKQLKDIHKNTVINKYWRGKLGQKNAGIVEIEYDLFVNSNKLRYTQQSASTLANNRRYTLTCNSPNYGIASAGNAFNHISNSMLFAY